MTTMNAVEGLGHRAAGSARVGSVRDRVGAAILFACAAAALGAAIGGVGTVADAGAAVQAVEAWRVVGFGLFAALFVLLALAPRQLRGLWEVTIAAKVALPVLGATVLRGADDATAFVVVDGTLALLLIAAYVLTAGWSAAPPRR